MTLRNDNPFNDLVQLVIAHGTDAMPPYSTTPCSSSENSTWARSKSGCGFRSKKPLRAKR